MKAINIAGFLFITFAAGTIQTMEKDHPNMFFNEKMLLDGDISAEQYLLNLENLNDRYSDMIRAIRTAEPLDTNDLYKHLIEQINSIPKDSAAHMRMGMWREDYFKWMYFNARDAIETCYRALIRFR